MNNILERVKQYFSSNFGKLGGIIAGLSFIITLLLSVSFKNRIDVSLLKAIISAVLTLVILFVLGMILRKYLGDVIDEAGNSANIGTDIDYGAIDDASANTSNSADVAADADNVPFTPDFGSISSDPNPVNTDKGSKLNYQDSDDIGDIVFSKPSSTQSTAGYSSSSSSMFPDKKVSDSEMLKEVQEDPEKVAKAVRTMIAKDERDENK